MCTARAWAEAKDLPSQMQHSRGDANDLRVLVVAHCMQTFAIGNLQYLRIALKYVLGEPDKKSTHWENV